MLSLLYLKLCKESCIPPTGSHHSLNILIDHLSPKDKFQKLSGNWNAHSHKGIVAVIRQTSGEHYLDEYPTQGFSQLGVVKWSMKKVDIPPLSWVHIGYDFQVYIKVTEIA